MIEMNAIYFGNMTIVFTFQIYIIISCIANDKSLIRTFVYRFHSFL